MESKFIPVNAMKVYRERMSIAPFLTPTINGGE
jgi:hypothetical protein